MFLNPLLLFGTLAISVPIVIHLLNRRKFQRVRWAAMRFLQTSVEKNRRRMRVEDLLLLCIRCLIVLLLALALARPAVRQVAAIFGRPPVTAMILLDNSASMGKTDGTQSRFDAAKKAADEWIADLPGGSSAGLIVFSDAADDVLPQPTADIALARDKVRQAALSDHATRVLAALQHARQVLDAAPGANKEICLITDGQANGWQSGGDRSGATRPANNELEVLRLLEDMKGKIATEIVLVGDNDAGNLSVDAIRLTTELPTVNKVLQFEVEVRNQGDAPAREVPVRLFVDDAASPAEEAIIDAIPARGSKSISLHARLRSDGYHGITARIPADALAVDDARAMVVRALKQVQVLLVDGEAGHEGRDEDTYFVGEALQPVALDARPGYFIQTRTITAGALPQSSLDSFDAVVLANVTSLPRTTVEGLQKYIKDGRGLIVFPGPNISASFYNDTLLRDTGILPASLGEAIGDSSQGEKFDTLESGHFTHPIMQLWNEEGRGNPAVAHFFRAFDLHLSDAVGNPVAGRAAVVARFASSRAAIVEHTYGDGRVVLFASTANTQWNDLPVRASIFIPLMHRVLDSIVERQDEHLAVAVGQKVILRMPEETLGKDVQIQQLPPAGAAGMQPAAAESTRVEMQTSWPAVAYERTDHAGIYRARVEGMDAPTLFAVQMDPAESDLTPLSPSEVSQLNVLAPVTAWKPGGHVAIAAVADTGREFWWPLAFATLIVACAESLLAYLFSRVK